MLKFITNTPSPIVAVLSGSMEPAFYRGDVLFLTQSDTPYTVGEIIVYKIAGRDIPIVHRIIEIRENEKGEQKILTKGDNNFGNDRGLYNPGQLWLSHEDIQGRVRGYVPYIGIFTIILNDYLWLKIGLFGIVGFISVFGKET